MTQNKWWILIPLVIIGLIYYIIRSTPGEANYLLINGIIYTLDSNNTVAQAIAIRENRIAAIGTSADLMRAFKSTNVIDLQGKTVIPGLIDGHCHVLGEGGRLQTLDLVGTTSPEQIAEMVAKQSKEIPVGQWIIGRGWDQNDWNNKRFPTHQLLDRAAPNNPVLLRRVDGHAMWVNTKTMQLAGITAQTRDPEGGKIHRDNAGNPTGVFVDNAIDLINRIIPELTEEEIEKRLKLALNECVQLGLTEVHDMGVDLQTIKIYKKLIDNGECPIRVYAVIDGPGETWNYYLQHGKEVGYGDGMLTVRAIKLYIDGALGSRGAALVEEYSDEPGNRGLTLTSEENLTSICKQALEHGFQVCTHAIGDRGNHITLNVYEKVLQLSDKSFESPRWRIEHAQVLLPFDIPRFKQLDILPSMQPTHATSDMYWAEERLGASRVKGAYAWRSILRTGAHIIGGSDFPVEAVNPMYGIYAAITRQDKDGNPPGGWYADQKMSNYETVKSFTHWAAYGSFEENVKGTIEMGKWADLVVLSKNVFQLQTKDIFHTNVVMTMVGGKIVYEDSIF
ncbi:MAG: amidohydrolase family protein [Bacteroidota bacterium]|nr:amidohydrolase family protein [Bacteroidota bacterium]